eukprot:6181553-Prorocentrum_lima.AAC.1
MLLSNSCSAAMSSGSCAILYVQVHPRFDIAVRRAAPTSLAPVLALRWSRVVQHAVDPVTP